MSGRLQAELKQRKPFRSLEEEAYLNLVRTEDALTQKQVELFRTAGLSASQYNVLRILRGAGPDGLPCGEIVERMVTRDPDMTRLLDRLEKRGLAARSREEKDRRVVMNRITDEGLRVLKGLDAPLLELLSRELGHLGADKLRELVTLLELAREPAPLGLPAPRRRT